MSAWLALSLVAIGSEASAGIVCGNFGNGFTCKSDSSAGKQFGKNATPGAPVGNDGRSSAEPPAGEAVPPGGGAWGTEQGTAAGTSDPTVCQHGMVGTPPNCKCPKNSELLGGNCVHYTASACSSGLASDAMPQACRSAEEKVSCTMRQDGLKDCCCVTYDKF
jgi:hypothetical protein